MRHTTVEQHGKHRVILALLIAGALALAGCSSPPKTAATTPPVSAPPTSEPATTPAPTPSTAAVYKPATDKGPAENVPVPALPEKAKEFSKEGFIAFAEYWYTTLSYVYETGDSDPMMAITDPDCKTCAFINDPIGQLYEGGGWIVGGQMTVIQSTSQFVEAIDGSFEATLMVQQAKVVAFKADGSRGSEHLQQAARANTVIASYVDEKWRARTAEPIGEG
ncbi:DUF6318 family protein [Arthrobacter sp. N199823]|uniref:DUF6318 family protein n=1 Tax=Arthrobacter sp. N199823 TaxID=2058895 RepID=UPI000CE49CC0|nr:DUF6318 family protein [Arthrobacter sp. N199823]